MHTQHAFLFEISVDIRVKIILNTNISDRPKTDQVFLFNFWEFYSIIDAIGCVTPCVEYIEYD